MLFEHITQRYHSEKASITSETQRTFHRCFFRVMLSMLLFDAFSDVIDAFSGVYPKSSSKVRKTPSKLPFSWKIMSFSNFVFVICELKCRKSPPAASRHTREQCIIVKMFLIVQDLTRSVREREGSPEESPRSVPMSSVLRLVGNQF